MIDRYDAPEGTVAVSGEQKACIDCACFREVDCAYTHRCSSKLRNDKEIVIFKTSAEFEKMLLQEIEQFYGKGKVKRIIFTKDNIK